MIGLFITVAIVLVVAVPVLLIALTGGPRTLFSEHALPEPRRRAPRRADR